MKTSRSTRRSACSATVPASVFSMGMTAAAAVPRATRSNTSAERAHGITVQPGSIFSAASWLKEPRSPWIATFIVRNLSQQQGACCRDGPVGSIDAGEGRKVPHRAFGPVRDDITHDGITHEVVLHA